MVIGQVKHWLKSLRLDRILKGQEIDLAELIEESFLRVNEQGTRNSVAQSLRLLNLDD